MFENFMTTYGMQLIGVILTAFAGVLATAVKRLGERYINTSEKRAVARTVVKAVEQIYRDLHGEEKLKKALSAAREMLSGQGIQVSEAELRLLIEEAVCEFNENLIYSVPLDDEATSDAVRRVECAADTAAFDGEEGRV